MSGLPLYPAYGIFIVRITTGGYWLPPSSSSWRDPARGPFRARARATRTSPTQARRSADGGSYDGVGDPVRDRLVLQVLRRRTSARRLLRADPGVRARA